MLLYLNSYLDSTKVLGPYERFALWTQGCTFDCPGCMSKDTHSLTSGKRYDVLELVDRIVTVPNIEGITISGGEPFLQVDALTLLVEEVKKIKDLGVIVYTGYEYSELKKNVKNSDYFLSMIDLLIDGRYEEEKNDNIAFRGSSNQQIHLLSDRYKSIYRQYYESYRREIELYMENDGISLVGIPQKKTLDKIRTLVGGTK